MFSLVAVISAHLLGVVFLLLGQRGVLGVHGVGRREALFYASGLEGQLLLHILDRAQLLQEVLFDQREVERGFEEGEG